MDVAPGYRQTEVGVIPEDWEVAAFDDICMKIKDGTHFSPKLGGTKYLYVTSRNIKPGHLNLSGSQRISEREHRKIYAHCDTRRGDLLLTKDGVNTGNAAINNLDEEISLLSSVAYLRFHTSHAPGFYLQYILSINGQRHIKNRMSGNAITRLTLKQIKTLRTPVPTLAEQTAIAEALSDADALIDALEAVRTKKTQVKQGAMQQLLTGKTRLPGFTNTGRYRQTEVGVIPEEWEVKRLDQLANIDPENLSSHTSPDYRFKYISLEDIDAGRLTGFSEQSFASAPSRARRKLRQDDVLVATVRPNLMSHLFFRDYSEDWVCSTGFCVLRCLKGLSSPAYLYAHMFSGAVNIQIDRLLVGSSYPAITNKDVHALRIPVPPLAEQTAIAEVLSDMDAEIAAVETKLTKAQQVKQGMMQALLTGRIRLV